MTTLARYDGVAFGISGSSVVLSPSASVAVRREDTGALISLYSDRAGSVGASNPITADAYGRWGFYAPAYTDGLKITVTEATSPGLQYTLRNVKNGTLGELDFNTLTLALLAASDEETFVQTLVNGLTAETNLATGDVIPFQDISVPSGRGVTVANLFKALSVLTANQSPDTQDWVLLYDTSAGSAKKVNLSDLLHDALAWQNTALLAYDVASGTAGGTSTGGSWQTRPLNTEVSDPNGIVTLSANQFTLLPGTYEIEAGGEFYSDSGVAVPCQHRIRNVADGVTVANGVSNRLHIPSGSSANVLASIPRTRFTVLASSPTPKFELQYWVGTGIATSGLGTAVSTGEVERYAYVQIRKVSD